MNGITRSTLAWVALAIAGLVVAVSVSFAASQLSKPRVGLASEPISGVADLAPKRARAVGRPARGTRTARSPAPASPSPAATTPSSMPSAGSGTPGAPAATGRGTQAAPTAEQDDDAGGDD